MTVFLQYSFKYMLFISSTILDSAKNLPMKPKVNKTFSTGKNYASTQVISGYYILLITYIQSSKNQNQPQPVNPDLTNMLSQVQNQKEFYIIQLYISYGEAQFGRFAQGQTVRENNYQLKLTGSVYISLEESSIVEQSIHLNPSKFGSLSQSTKFRFTVSI
ncbi:hypothetical protein TTHERM_000709688 (macronuclear) [Tetrahymena thermophila SB210]|uniref:Uncharacterized protein n=1 Tax=Tetrahymena thermophila (strain SB210) TaxID=312017 RepID=W7XL56_TETTS|nr:hypothetical protein TTHERM_000709688 [Tetrahymena thermophila SB210]EWS75704.1 hypothetical protein TTHERM_000709688 [Tetrahymena thermophila SB210]|eukprot:XP_012651777.1 hypothetical protein TTHERM_000709688 [Tetrahymena thermophila SB210]